MTKYYVTYQYSTRLDWGIGYFTTDLDGPVTTIADVLALIEVADGHARPQGATAKPVILNWIELPGGAP